MKWILLIGKNLIRNKKRTLLTLAAVALALFIFTMLQTILSAMEFQVSRGPGETRLGVIEKYAGPRRSLPATYQPQLQRFEGVVAVTPTNFDILSVGRSEVYYIALLVNPETYREVFASTVSLISTNQYDDFLRRRNGVIAGEKIAENYGWKVGDNIKLQSLQQNVTLDLVVSGIYPTTGENADQMDTRLLINRTYYENLINKPGRVTIFWLRLDKPASTLPVMKAVSDYYSIGPMEVSVETESSMLARLTSYTATIQLIIRVISTVVLFTILLVTINTIALSIRERRKEIAVMKALGYTPQNVRWLIIGESVFISLLAGLIGTILAYALFNLRGLTLSLGLTFDFRVQPEVVITGIVISIILGIVSGLLPAYNASRLNVIKVIHSL